MNYILAFSHLLNDSYAHYAFSNPNFTVCMQHQDDLPNGTKSI